jgi:hypothetical protein
MATVPKEDIPGNLVPAFDLPDTARPSVPEKKEDSGFLGRAKKVAAETGIGGVAGAFAPEIMSYGVAPALRLSAMTAPFSAPTYELGQALRAQRLKSAGAGAFGGAVGETGGQTVEALGGSKGEAEAARFIGGLTAPSIISEPARLLTKAGGYGLSALLNRATGLPIGTAARTIGQIADEKGVKELNLTAQQKQFINDKLNSIRGGAESFQPAKDVFAMLRKSADSILNEAEKKTSDLQSLRTIAETEANKVREQAKNLAQAVRDKAATQAPELRSRAEQEATAILTTADQEASKIVNEAQQRVTKMEGVRERLGPKTQKRIEAVQQKTSELGKKRRSSELGSSIRQFFEGEFNRLKGVREGNVQTLKTAAFDEAAAKERSGKRYQETKAYKEAISLIDNKVKNAETGLLNVGPDELKGLTAIRDVIRRGVGKQGVDEAGNPTVTYTPLSFQALENMRRQLRDRAFGLPAEGYDAIGQQRAGDLAESIEKIQREFSPGFGKYLEQYKADSQPLNDFKSKLGQAILGKSESDFGKYSTDEFALADKAFYSAGSVDQLTKIAGPKAAEQLARSFIANRIKGGSAKEISSVIQDRNISDWIGKFPALEQELNNLAQQAGIVERVGKKREGFAEYLRKQIGTLPTAAGTQAETLASKAAREAGGVTRKAEAAATKLEQQATDLPPKIESRGERAAEKVVSKAEADIAKKTSAITQEAQRKADLILGKAVEPKRVADFLLRGTRDEWSTIAPIISGTPGGKEKLASAVGQVIADRANQSLKGAIADMKLMADNLVSSNLMSQADANKLISKLEEVFVMPIDNAMRVTLSKRLITNAIVGTVGYGAGAAKRKIEGLVE